MYLQNKYTTWYHQIIKLAQSKNRRRFKRTHPDYIYFEQHHIIPKSLGGGNDKNNLVLLTPKEHFICHLLLTKMTIGNDQRSMAYALWAMSNQSTKNQKQRYKCSSITYAYAKNIAGDVHSKSQLGKTLEERLGSEKAAIIKEKFKHRKARGSPSLDERKRIGEAVSQSWKTNNSPRGFQLRQPETKQCEKCRNYFPLGVYAWSHGPKCTRIDRTCPTCNTNFQTTKHENKTYCSKACSNRRHLLSQ